MAEFKNIDVTELKSLLEQGNIRLVDVRTEAEVRQGFIKGAEMLPLHCYLYVCMNLIVLYRLCSIVALAHVRRRLRRSPQQKVLQMLITCKAESWRGRRRVYRW